MQSVEQFRHDLLTWYSREKRDLPWRKTTNPYYIWISEIMLQQTRVDTVIPYYERFIQKFPTVEHLAQSEEQDVLKLWEGLGYYSRARNLRIGAQQVVEHYQGVVPKTRKEILTIKGIGPYTAGAILSIAYGLPEHAVDGNVMRVMSRLFYLTDDIAKPKSKKVFERAVMKTMSERDPSSFNQALMELGAVVCTPKNPTCLLCPVRSHCRAYDEGVQHQLPVKNQKTKVTEKIIVPFLLQNEKGEWLVRQRPSKGLLSNLWEFPYLEVEPTETLRETKQKMSDSIGRSISIYATLPSYKHVFSHLIWHITPLYGRVEMFETDGIWVTEEQLQALPRPVPVLKAFESYEAEAPSIQMNEILL